MNTLALYSLYRHSVRALSELLSSIITLTENLSVKNLIESIVMTFKNLVKLFIFVKTIDFYNVKL
jgi:hypothetical protein